MEQLSYISQSVKRLEFAENTNSLIYSMAFKFLNKKYYYIIMQNNW